MNSLRKGNVIKEEIKSVPILIPYPPLIVARN